MFGHQQSDNSCEFSGNQAIKQANLAICLYIARYDEFNVLLRVSECSFFLIYIAQDIGEHLTTVHLKRCERGKRCLYEGSSPPGGFPNSWVCNLPSYLHPLYYLPKSGALDPGLRYWVLNLLWFLVMVIYGRMEHPIALLSSLC